MKQNLKCIYLLRQIQLYYYLKHVFTGIFEKLFWGKVSSVTWTHHQFLLVTATANTKILLFCYCCHFFSCCSFKLYICIFVFHFYKNNTCINLQKIHYVSFCANGSRDKVPIRYL